MPARALDSPEQVLLLQDRIKTGYPVNVILSCVLSLIIASCFYASSELCRHWFVFPLLFCGVLLGADAISWLRGKIDPFDPIGIIGLMLFLRYFVGTFFNVTLDHWLPYVQPPPDWRPWVGGMALLNLAGLLAYQSVRFVLGPREPLRPKRVLVLQERVFTVTLYFFLAVAVIVQAGIYHHLDGIQGFISAYEQRSGWFEGAGPAFMLSESFPILAMMGYAAYVKTRHLSPSWPTLLLVLGLFFVTKMLFGGLRGSRSEILFGLFWAVGIIHFWIRTVPKRLIVLGLAGGMVFAYAYGFYKGAGVEGVTALLDKEERGRVEQQTGRTMAAAWLGSATQPYTLYRLMEEDRDYEYAYGMTYLGALAKTIPRTLWPSRPPGKIKEGTELFYGEGAYPEKKATMVWGLAGEAMLNFGPFAAPLAFTLLGVAVAAIRRWMISLSPWDSRWLIMPFFVSLCILMPGSDSDNLVFYFFKNGTVPLLLVWIGSGRLREDAKSRG